MARMTRDQIEIRTRDVKSVATPVIQNIRFYASIDSGVADGQNVNEPSRGNDIIATKANSLSIIFDRTAVDLFAYLVSDFNSPMDGSTVAVGSDQ